MERSIARLNIEHFRRLLESETDPTKRQTIERLLAEEQAKLASISQETSSQGQRR
jgi:hypothetical protein